jgi:hypothetical protein
MGNAAIDLSITDLADVINDKREECMVRHTAIDALRRLRTQMPHMIQGILMPLFQNNQEKAEVRIAAFGQILNTMPNQQVIDQITFALTVERSQHVLAFVYNTMKAMSKTRNPLKQELAKHIQNALKLVNVDDQALKMTGLHQIPIYSPEQNEGIFFNLVSAFSPRNAMPVHLSAQLNSVLNGEYQTNDIGLMASMQNADQWYERVQQIFQQTVNVYNRAYTRGQRNQEKQGSTLNDIHRQLGIKSRRSSSYSNYPSMGSLNIQNKGQSQQQNRNNQAQNQGQQQQQDRRQEPFMVFTLRVSDIDQIVIPMSENTGPHALREILFGENKFSLNQIISEYKALNNGVNIRKSMVSTWNEKRANIATSSGLPLKALQFAPMITTLQARAQVNVESSSLSSPLGLKAQVQGQASLNVAYIQKLEVWLPIFATGTASIRSLELNIPVNAEITANSAHGLQVRIKMPQNKKELVLGLHSIPTTYTAEFDQAKNSQREPKFKVGSENLFLFIFKFYFKFYFLYFFYFILIFFYLLIFFCLKIIDFRRSTINKSKRTSVKSTSSSGAPADCPSTSRAITIARLGRQATNSLSR